MELTVLSVPDCPSVGVLTERLHEVLGGRRDVRVAQRVVQDEVTAIRTGMHGSPTLLVDGRDPFAEPGQSPSLSCRLYRGAGGTAIEGAPSVAQLRAVLVEDVG